MSSIAVNAITDANAGNTATINSVTPNTSNVLGKNRIINGNMVIDQRNSGGAITINTTGNIYSLDRWTSSGANSNGVFTIQQSTEAPAGFTNSRKITVTTAAASIGSAESYLFSQFIEGNNIADLGFGTANAKTITVSFWVRSSLTGTFGGALNNSANDRNYPFTYSISAADTWEYKTITIAGDTSGTWLTDTSRGIGLRFQIGIGSDRIATAGSWTGTSSIFGAIGATNIIETLNATWYITGVQLEAGSSATEFEHRQYGTELALCQRYALNPQNLKDAAYNTASLFAAKLTFPVTMRATPSVDMGSVGTYKNTAGAAGANQWQIVNWASGGSVTWATAPTSFYQTSGDTSGTIPYVSGGSTPSETSNYAVYIFTFGSGSRLIFSAEL